MMMMMIIIITSEYDHSTINYTDTLIETLQLYLAVKIS